MIPPRKPTAKPRAPRKRKPTPPHIPPTANDALARDYESLHRSYLALRREVDQLSTLREIGLAIAGILDLNEVLASIARVVQGELEVRRLTLYEVSQDTQTLQPIIAQYGDDLIRKNRLQEESASLRGTTLGTALLNRNVVIETNAFGSVADIPLVANNELLGMMRLEDRRDGRPFCDDDAALFRLLASHIAVAIANARLYALAVTDGLTGLYVRRYFDLRMDEEFHQARRYGRAFSLLLFDIDHFKRINDVHGHPTGDAALRTFADLLRRNTRRADVCCRYGGEEMAVILPETRLQDAVPLAEKLCDVVRKHPFPRQDGAHLQLTTSIGVAEYCSAFESASDVVRAADHVLYKAKESGRDRVGVWKNAAPTDN